MTEGVRHPQGVLGRQAAATNEKRAAVTLGPRRRALLKLAVARGALAAGLMVTAATSPPASQAASPGLNGKIAFISNRDGNQEIYVMNADGTNPTRLTFTSANELAACWSPDGAKIALTSERDGNPEIYVMDADGTNTTRLTNNSAFDGVDPQCWSPDGTEIAFISNRTGNMEIYVMDPNGSGPTNLTNHSADDIGPTWSPDGTQIAFASYRDGISNPEIYVMDADGTNQSRLTNNSVPDSNPSWSPDGTKIAFSSVRDFAGINQDIFVMNADGTNQTNLTNIASADESADWSPDGTKITFASYRDGTPEIYVMNANGSGQTNLTNNSATDLEPAWQPLYDFSGFFRPVDNPGPGPTFVFNLTRAGSAVPVKFSLNGDQGLNVLDTGYPVSQKIECDASATFDDIEQTVTAGSSSLSYDAATDQYVYVWKTDKAWAGTCRQLTVRLNDFTTHLAYFAFTK